VVSATDPPVVNSVFLTGAATYSFKWLRNYPHEAEWTPFQTHYYSENLEAPGISGSVDHRGGLLEKKECMMKEEHLSAV
jgi:hypothetical protein